MRATYHLQTFALAAALLAGGLSLSSCLFEPEVGFKISGRLGNAFGCYVLTSAGRTYELSSWRDPIPPAGSFVTLRVRSIGGASTCMVGEIVKVIRVLEVRTDFRTAPVTGDETWGPDSGPIVLGQVEVRPGATLTILPGTVVTISDYGALRVRGGLVMAGTPGDSIRVVSRHSGLGGGGRVSIDSTASARIEYAVLGALSLSGSRRELQNLRIGYLTVRQGLADLRHVVTSGLSSDGGHVSAEDSELGNVAANGGAFAFLRCRMTRLDLSYSMATVLACSFEGSRTYVLLHGASGGTFQRTVFRAAETVIEVRHTSTGDFRDNDFVSPIMRVECGSYQLGTCVNMGENWWGTAVEEEIRAKIQESCPVCIEPWRTEPVNPQPSP